MILKAKLEQTPQIDVSQSVMKTITAEINQQESLWERPLMWIAFGSSAAAVSLIILAVISFHSWTGPLFELKQAIQWVL